MARMLDHVEYLSKELGARPAGTEEEQQAAIYIADQLQHESGFHAEIEEFTSSSNIEGGRAVLCVLTIVVAVLGMLFNVLAIPAFILAAASAVVYTLEAFDRPVVSRALSRGASQNVVAKYQPGAASAISTQSGRGRGRKRKIILVAHYDSGKVTPGLVKRIESSSLPVPLICVGGMIAAAFFLLLQVFLGPQGGMGVVVLDVLTVISLVICALPIVKAVLYRLAPYNEGANNNAAGVAALIEVARRISRGSVSEADLAAGAQDVTVHGAEAALASGLVPEGAQIVYEAERLQPPDEIGAYDEEERLLAAKAAIAALTGHPVERRVYGSVASKLVNSRAPEEGPQYMEITAGQAADSPAEQAEAPADEPTRPDAAAPAETGRETASARVAEEPVAGGFENAPSWFIAAQQNAKKPVGATPAPQRSRYTEAIESAEREAAERERAREEEERARAEAERRAREEAARAAVAAAQQDLQANAVPEPQPDPVPDPGPEPAGPDQTSYQAPIHVTAQDLAAAGVEPAATSLAGVPEVDQVPAPQPQPQPANRLAALPSIDTVPVVPETKSPSRSGLFRMLRTDVPSLSGVIRMQAAGQDVSQKPAAAQVPEVVPAPAPEPSAEAVDYDMQVPVADEFAEPAQPVRASAEPQAADPVAAQAIAHEPAYEHAPEAAPAPDPDDRPARSGGLRGRFRRKNREELSDSPQEWLGVDDDFDARSVGRKRGGWESFRDDDDDDFGSFGTGDDEGTGRRWQGGAFSRVRLGHVDMKSGEESTADEPMPEVVEEDARSLTGEIEQIYHFRNPLYNTEIWFVAVGSSTELNDGARAFIEEHRDDLRGTMCIQVESLGAGALSVATEEGHFSKVKASSRVKRYTKQATMATGISLGDVSLAGADSFTTVVQRAGYQAMHLLGVEDDAPALKGSADDVLENIDELVLDDNVNFLMELLKKG